MLEESKQIKIGSTDQLLSFESKYVANTLFIIFTLFVEIDISYVFVGFSFYLIQIQKL